MSTNIVVPELGESVVEATVARWLKKEGDRVSVGEPVVELETEKIDLEVGASQNGVLARIAQPEGSDVRIGEVLGVIEPAAEAARERDGAPEAREAAAPEAREAAPAPVRARERPAEPERARTVPPAEARPAAAAPEKPERARATASAKRLADEHDVDLSGLRGTGESGRVTRQDVERYLEARAAREPERAAPPEPAREPAPAAASEPVVPAASPRAEPAEPARPRPRAIERPEPAPISGPPAAEAVEEAGRLEERVRMSRRRQTVARRLVEAQRAAAMLTTFNEVDMTAVQDLRRRRREAFKARHGVGLGVSSFFVKASVAALRAFPRLNAEVQGDEMVLKRYYDIGIAVGASEGLVVPVLRDADRLSFAEIEQRIKDFARRAGDGRLTLDDLRGGTFTITNGGIFGSLLSTPILNPPQVGILGLHKIEDRAVPHEGQVVIRPMMYIALSYDHRIVDGLEAVQFLVKIKELIEDPAGLLLE
jgi:2-oxoglutarate dehydrogenase E2 component (dihydrolipoamide succinyltransferase)